MLGFHDDPHASRREFALEPAGDLHGHPLLDLQVASEQLDDPGQLAQPDDALAR
jgi:hypothetical protein